MNPLKKIKTSIGNFILAKKQKRLKRTKKVHNLTTAKDIGVLFEVTHMEDYHKIDPFLSFLSEKDINLFALAYYPRKEIPENLHGISTLNIFCNGDLNWYRRPKGLVIDKFMRKNFDILIDLSNGNYFPVKYINNLSKAGFKVGKNGKSGFEHDLFIQINENHEENFYIEQLKYYLSNINKNNGV